MIIDIDQEEITSSNRSRGDQEQIRCRFQIDQEEIKMLIVDHEDVDG